MLRSVRWRIALPYAVLIVLTTVGLTFYISEQVRRARLADLQAQLLIDARFLADSLQPLLGRGASVETLDALAHRWADLLEARVTIIGANGVVLGESHRDRALLDNHLDRPEVQEALGTGQGTSIRFSQTVGYEMLYAARPVTAEGQTVGLVRVALPLDQIEAGVVRLRSAMLAAGGVTLLLAIALAVLIAERAARPVRSLTRLTGRLAEGDLSARLSPARHDEVGQLTVAFNDMADRLQRQLRKLSDERSRLAAVLEHMADGVLITDGAGTVQLINPAAARLLGVPEAAALGRSFVEVVRDHQLVELWEDCCQGNQEQVAAIELERLGLFLQVIITPLRNGEAPERFVILQDLTQIRRLETTRRDFVSNISHELRTPLASLKAVADTLRDGALDDPPAAQRFLDRIDVEVDALTQMVQELLELSRIESGLVPFRLLPTPVSEVVLPSAERLRPQAERAELEFTIELPPALPLILADAERVQQVVTNLVHNAIKFTPPGGVISVTATFDADEVVVSVADTGVGIPADDLPRIFERFYKADRARSGGGTGLGLAIAKHIVQGHGGRIWVESVEGQGSAFYFSLPAAR
ncbi:MAG: ATP-binding protein [Anaerolineae bacterium]